MTPALLPHLEAYRFQVRAESPAGAADYARLKATQRPDLYPTVYDFLAKAMSEARAAAAGGDAGHYQLWLGHHQAAMLDLFEEMVSDELWDYRRVTADNILGLIDDHGWTWFKYCRRSIEFTIKLPENPVDVLFVPRYAEKYQTYWQKPGKAVFDASEMGTVFVGASKDGGRRQLGAAALALKAAPPLTKILAVSGDGRILRHRAVRELNRDWAVDDWSLGLWST